MLIEMALDGLLDQMERDKIDRSFAAMTDDSAFLSLQETLADAFADSDWEALQLAEAQDFRGMEDVSVTAG